MMIGLIHNETPPLLSQTPIPRTDDVRAYGTFSDYGTVRYENVFAESDLVISTEPYSDCNVL